MAWEIATVQREGHVTIVTLNRPEAMNALHRAAHFELAEIWDDFAADPDQWVAIVTGAGDKAFTAGEDLKALADGRGGHPPQGFAGITGRHDLIKPVIAAVNGIAMGGGLEVVLACDIAVASETAVFGLPEPRVGVAALAGGLHRLPRQIPVKHAMGMILTGRRVPAAEALALGFVNEVVPQDEVMASARRWAADILKCSPMSVRASKEAVQTGLEKTLDAALAEQTRAPAMRALFKSDDMKEGPRAFAEKRAPNWRGA